MRISVNSFRNCVYVQQTFLSFGPIQALYLRVKIPWQPCERSNPVDLAVPLLQMV